MTSDEAVVLIVEDDEALADLYTTYLDDTYTVRTAYTGEEALELIDNDIDIALLDRLLGEWHGDELVTVIHDRQIDCQIAMVTAVRPDFDIIDLPISDYLTKPISREELCETVEELLHWTQQTVTKQELLALISRKIALEREKATSELQANREYVKLEHRIDLVMEQLDLDANEIREASSKYRHPACPQCGLRWDVSVSETSGFVRMGSHVWKCLRCGAVEYYSGPSERRVARR